MNFLNKFKYARDSYLATILIVAIVVMVNFIAARHFIKVDLTKNKIYAVSDASKQIMNNLSDIVTVKVFFSDKLPPDLFAVQQYVGDTLGELSSYSKGNLSVRLLNPEKPEIKKEALSLGIPQIQMNVIEKDKLEVKNGFLGIAVTYGGKTEIMPVVQNILNVEYDLVSAIKKVVAVKTPAIGFISDHGEPSLKSNITSGSQGNSFNLLNKALSKNYKVTSVKLQKEDELDNLDTLVLAGSKTLFTEDELKKIDKFVINGGNLVVLLDMINIDTELKTSDSEINLNKLLKGQGVEISNKLILDTSNERATFNQGYMNFIIPYPFWVKGVNRNFNKSNPVVSNLNSIVFPWASPLQISKKEGVKSTILISTTKKAWTQESPYNLNPNAIQAPGSKNQYPLAVLIEGKITSVFEQKSDKNKKSGSILVTSNSRFITDRFLKLYNQNLIFIMNAIDFLTLDESLISIRSKTSLDLT